jgi:D-alanine--poly(phosphoribitol) ligase subunit 1
MTFPYLDNLHRAFACQASANAESPALVMGPREKVTYAALGQRSDYLACYLSSIGVGRGDVVGIFHSKKVDGYAVMLACLKIGAPYVNLDDDNPPDRLRRILETSQPRVLVADGPVPQNAAHACASVGLTPIDLAGLPATLPAAAARPPTQSDEVIGSDIAYIMFTSGSTGIPKGVAISHAQVLNFIAWTKHEFGIVPGDIISNVNPMFFDNSVFDFYASLFNGAALAPIPRALLKDPQQLAQQVTEADCTVWFSVPSLLIYLTTTHTLDQFSWPTMRSIVFGGEGYPKPELQKLHELLGSRVRFVNVYGPTECTCICSAYDVTDRDFVVPSGLPPIGHLARNFRGLLLDGDQIVAPGETGELCLLGPNVGIGYYRDPVRSNEAFVANPACTSHTERMYRTGDLMRKDPADGLLRFVARKDNQIKHMGYRIELEEIEAALACLPGVSQCAVVYKRSRSQFGNIVAYVAGDTIRLDAEQIADRLRTVLPPYMVPRQIKIRDALPKNANGKIDRKTLTEEA